MNPPVPAVLAELAGLSVRNAMPDVHPADRASSLGLSAALLGVAAEVWDGMAARLVAENRAIRPLLARGEEVGLDLAVLAAGDDADLRLSALKAGNDTLRAALIELQAQAEAKGATDLQAAIWAELVASTERRKLASSPV
ncbi:hypothetical protein GGQ61_001802 [Phenylobacterium haematophilum]|uniref:Uncharacterized protein n=1 Tax=Phenylobacterium haematophilum TaxID=98513 RepID=A0A839ZX37_9CAUL|nr:hypothetical protein [Phenylobacterium haematophilum]MBB3891085.1 hypothetical protein [Phenylobacterium haematophilum]